MTIKPFLPSKAVTDYLVLGLTAIGWKVTLEDPDEPPPIDPPPQTRPLGINLAWVNYYASELPFNDVLKGARPYRLDGSTVVCVDIGDHYPAGIYTCTHDGVGSLRWSGAATEAGGPGIMVDPSNAGIRLKVIGSVRNVRLTLPGAPNDATWRPGFLSRWSKFQVIRFMDWQRTNNSTLSKWSDRTTLDSETQGSDMGVALEHMIDLCNVTRSDPWFCIPHLADDEFVREFAKMVRATLQRRKVYVEHSNEVWNGHFSQSAYATQQGLDLGLSTEPNTANARYHAQRTVDIGNAFKAAGLDVVTVLGGQTVNTWLTRTMLDHRYPRDMQFVWEQVDALGIAPYLGAAANQSKTVDDYLREMEANIPRIMPLVQEQDNEARARNVTLVAYEGGQGLRAKGEDQENPTITARLIATNNDPRMHGVYEKYLRAWDEASREGLMVHFNSTREPNKHGSWGALNYYDSDETERGKYSALVDYIEGR